MSWDPTRRQAAVLYWVLLVAAALLVVLIAGLYDVPIVLPGLAVVLAGAAGITEHYR